MRMVNYCYRLVICTHIVRKYVAYISISISSVVVVILLLEVSKIVQRNKTLNIQNSYNTQIKVLYHQQTKRGNCVQLKARKPCMLSTEYNDVCYLTQFLPLIKEQSQQKY